MLDRSNKKQLSDLNFQEFIDKTIQKTKLSQSHSENYSIVRDTERYLDKLEKAFTSLSSLSQKKKLASKGVEWFLDNFFVIQKAIELIQDDLPENYFEKLPALQEGQAPPRIYHLARIIVSYYEVELVQNDLNDFLTAYQEAVPLKMSELWALPLMLRLVMVELVSNRIEDLVKDEGAAEITKQMDAGSLPSDEVVARALRTLLLFDRIDWKDFFEAHAKVEKILKDDPAGIYPQMDFDTRDIYRKKIEGFAEKSCQDEIQVAKRVVRLASKKGQNHPKRSHVGYFLIGEGQSETKSIINYEKDFHDKLVNIFFKHNTNFYLGGIAAITLLVVALLIFVSQLFSVEWWQSFLIGLAALTPASSVAVNLVNSILTASLPPDNLPKLDFSKAVPRDFRTVVVIPSLLTDFREIGFLLDQIELHYLSNKDRNIGFALLTDFSDAPQETTPEDKALVEAAVKGINDLNDRYRGDDGRKPFYLFHRKRQWNPKENAWIGWERKRGKLSDFNRFLLEGYQDSFDTTVGELDFMEDVRFVITLDADTVLPRDSARSLIGTLAHPLNRAEFNEESSQVVSGYTILQPRTEVKPTSVNKSLFTRVFAGDLGLDLYTRAVSDVYQDLFGEGSYVGKGIYDVSAFQRSIKDKAPDNALLSHDLFEGLQGRAGLVSDIVFFEEYPPDYASQVKRRHRWVRGDWQLLPWLFPRVPTAEKETEKNPFKAIDLWKLFDNLRRSLLEPATFLSLVIGWLVFNNPGAWAWTGLLILISAFPLFKNIVTSLTSRFIMGARSNLVKNIQTAFLRWVFWLMFLPYESLIMVDAILTTLIRVFISHQRLLQWQTSAHTIRIFGKQRKIATIWQRMLGAPLLSLAVGLVLLTFNSDAFFAGLALLLVWSFSPQIAYWISLEHPDDPKSSLTEDDLQKFRQIARRTWLYFERFIGPEDHWLPPDHYQADPKGVVAHRTSPTNIGLMMLSSAAAYDFGYIGVLDFIYRMNYTFETLDDLEKYRGHLLNWYDTRSLNTLSPRYVSTVDSGNFATSLIGLYQTLMDVPEDSLCPSVLFSGAYDSLDVFCQVVEQIENKALQNSVQPLHEHCRNLQKDIKEERLTDSRQMEILDDFKKRITEPMNVLIKDILSTEEIIDKEILADLRYWSDTVFQHLMNIQRQINLLAPWLETWRSRPEYLDEVVDDDLRETLNLWYEDRALQMGHSEWSQISSSVISDLEQLIGEKVLPFEVNPDQAEEIRGWVLDFIKDLQESRSQVKDLCEQISQLLEKIDFYIDHMEFDFLFDEKREVFFLGYQVGSGRMDKNHYDLLASEARTASLFAIARNQVPRSHWLHMSRPFTVVSNKPTLVSWNGSMFEYLMPNLFTRTYPETLLHQTSQGVVEAQIKYAKQNNVPWGISESSYYRFDQADNYQYKGFGVPELGRKRGLADELVIAPYASLLAVGVRPKAVLDNIADLEAIGALSHFGFYESIDYTTSRLPVGQDKAIVKSYMAHHQGMILVALANFLNKNSLVNRVHADPRIQSTELLLQEQIPEAESITKAKDVQVAGRGEEVKGILVIPWTVDHEQPGKSVHVLSNGKLRLLTTESGSGSLEWGETALTRWQKDAVLDPWGIWFYLQNLDHGNFWSIGKAPVKETPAEYRVIYAPHMVEIRQVLEGLRTIIQTTIAPQEDICFQKITLTNHAEKSRRFRLMSYGEVVLAPQSTDRQHPAFNKMFIESSFNDSLNMLHFKRRMRSSNDDPKALSHLLYEEIPGTVQFEGDREKFIGRGHGIRQPMVLSEEKPLSGTVGFTLDPIFSISKEITLEPNQTVTLTYMTIASKDKEQAEKLAKKYQSMTRIDNVFNAAESHSEKLLRALDLESEQLSKFEELLTHIIYPLPVLRPKSSELEKNSLGQSGLWSFGISGDYPLLLVMIDRQDDIEALQQTLLAHTYWRKMGLMIDLVILNTKDSGYTHELNERIHQAINVMDSQSWVNRRGGIFVLTASQIDKKPLDLLKTAASAVIEFKKRSLDDHLRLAREIEPHLPPLIPSSPDREFKTEERLSRPEDLILENGIGGFTPDGREYQIFMEDYPELSQKPGQVTPAPWTNVIANEDFGFLITESGGGYSWAGNSGENRLTPWTNDPVSDPTGEILYLRDEITGSVWSPTPYPCGAGSDYLVRHGQGYTIFESYNQGFKQELKVFADPDAPVKIIEMRLENQAGGSRRVTATYFAEWVLGSHRADSGHFILPSYDNQTGSLMARNSYSAEFSERVAFLTSDQSVHGITTDRPEFLGFPGNRRSPAGLRRVGLSGQVQAGGDICAALQVHLNFKPGESKTFRFALGQGEDLAQAKTLAETYSQPEKADESFEAMVQKWDALLETLQVETPNLEMDVILNRWMLYQALSCRIWGRSALYQSSGAYGFRDQLQDITSILSIQPEIAREHILRSARHQFREGDVLHWWHPPSGHGVRTRITDDLLWLVYVTAEYVNKTGDDSILEERVPFCLGEPLEEEEEERYSHYETSETEYTIFEHCQRALEHGDTEGPHGLPLIGSGDWNDGMNRVGIEGQGESVWLAWFLVENHRRFADLCDLQDVPSLSEKHRDRAQQLQKMINQVAWDDNWYLRAYYDDGASLGSHRSEECQIDSLPQSWAILTHGSEEDRGEIAMQSVEEHLVMEEARLIRLFTPPFDKTQKDPGYIKGYPPGIRENGGQYTHAAIWAVWALTELGLGNLAFKRFSFLNPVTHSQKLENANCYKVEPYVVAADIYSTPPHVGHGGWTWYTGSSGWLYRLGMEAILGFQHRGDHFTIDPCIPQEWDGFTLRFKNNGTHYNIQIQNPEHVQKGVKSVTLDGEVREDLAIPLEEDGEEHQVEVNMG
jgi:cyclic beta-1,2-glucan synthetase